MKKVYVISLDEEFEKSRVKAHTRTRKGKLERVKEFERRGEKKEFDIDSTKRALRSVLKEHRIDATVKFDPYERIGKDYGVFDIELKEGKKYSQGKLDKVEKLLENASIHRDINFLYAIGNVRE